MGWQSWVLSAQKTDNDLLSESKNQAGQAPLRDRMLQSMSFRCSDGARAKGLPAMEEAGE